MWRAALSAFLLTVCLTTTVGAFIAVDLQVGRTLFGDAYASAAFDISPITEMAQRHLFLPIPARLQALLQIPRLGADCVGWLLSR